MRKAFVLQRNKLNNEVEKPGEELTRNRRRARKGLDLKEITVG